MSRPKIRDKTTMNVDIVLKVKLSQFRKQWEQIFGEPISEIEMTKIFGEFGKIDFEIVKKYRKT